MVLSSVSEETRSSHGQTDRFELVWGHHVSGYLDAVASGLVIFDGAQVTDTLLHGMAGVVLELPDWLAVAGIYLVQVVLNYFVPSGSGQAALSIPILAPLGDLVGVTRQTVVLAYQFGDGFSNVFTPTQGYFMAGLALIGVRWERWIRFIWPLECLWLLSGLVLLLVAHAIRLGPF